MTAPAGRARKIFLIATEESGDRLGAALMRALRERADIRFAGVGGREMAREGLRSLFPIDDLAIMGFFAIPARLPMILRRIRAAADAAIADRPDALVIIDSPDFTHRVARRVRAAAPAIPIVDYVSPSVWVWRPRRARAMRDYVDHILALLPFEPEVHRQLGGPPCTYIGHPVLEQVAQLRPGADAAARREKDPPVILVLPGSRRGEISRHLGVFGETLAILTRRHGPLEAVLPTVPQLLERVQNETAAWTVRPRIVVEPQDKWAAFRSARAALAASGTVTLELAVANVPTVVAYKVPLIEELIVRMLARHHPVLKTRTIVLANLVLGEAIMPELLQRQVGPERLAAELLPLLGDTPERARQLAAFARLDAVMEIAAARPSAKGADMVLEIADRGRPAVPIPSA
jgi:lipid-A-disaccharide synthase